MKCSGRCELAKALQGEGFNLIASDISFGVLSNNAAENVIQARAEDIPFPSDFFDIALGFDVIEHFPDIETHLEEVNRVLKEGGQYIFETPNLLISRFWERLKGNSFSEQRIYHPSVQSYWGLKDVFTRSGFEVELVKMPFMEGKAPDELNGIFGKASNVFQRIDWERWPQFLYPMFYGVAKNTFNIYDFLSCRFFLMGKLRAIWGWGGEDGFLVRIADEK